MKTVTFAVVHYTVAFTVVFALSGDILLSTAAGAVEPAVNTLAYHWHEKIWRRHGERIERRMRAAAGFFIHPPARAESALSHAPPRRRGPSGAFDANAFGAGEAGCLQNRTGPPPSRGIGSGNLNPARA